MQIAYLKQILFINLRERERGHAHDQGVETVISRLPAEQGAKHEAPSQEPEIRT